MDDTSEAILSLWGITSTSPTGWQPSQTTLLITSPSLNVLHQNWLALTSNAFIDVDPVIPEAERLRAYAGQMIKRQHINPIFPDKGEYPSTDISHIVSRSCRVQSVEYDQAR
jgi:hypothetical protein